jgi:hypothetical protein
VPSLYSSSLFGSGSRNCPGAAELISLVSYVAIELRVAAVFEELNRTNATWSEAATVVKVMPEWHVFENFFRLAFFSYRMPAAGRTLLFRDRRFHRYFHRFHGRTIADV